MKSFVRSIAVLVGLSLLSAGCVAGSSEEEEESQGSPALQPLDGPTGSTGPNGLLPSIYHARITALDNLFQQPLTVDGLLNPSADFTSFISTPDGALLFGYAVGCALPTYKSAGDFQGGGLMAYTGGWFDGPLDFQQRSDVHTCITTRLNPYQKHVGIWIGGPDTSKDTGSDTYPYFEAVWSVSVIAGAPRVFSVWPSDTFTQRTSCGLQGRTLVDDFNTRICENNPLICHITLRKDMSTACTGTPGEGKWICDGKPAIETRLKTSDWNLMHPKCLIATP